MPDTTITQRIIKRAAQLAFGEVLKNGSAKFADNEAMAKKINEQIPGARVGVRRVPGTSLGVTEVYLMGCSNAQC